MMRIIIACGGTGGHIFPGLSLYRALKKIQPEADIVLALDKRDISAAIVTDQFKHVYLTLGGLQNTLFVLKLFQGALQSLKIILKLKPDLVVGFGGYASFFPVFFAWIFRIRTVIHEQNVVPGRSNRMLAPFVNRIAVSFAQTREYFGANFTKVTLTGNPLRPNLAKLERRVAEDFLGFYPGKLNILVIGGSQGAHKINSVFLEAVSLIKDRCSLQIIHLCGEKDCPGIKNGYQDLGIRARVFAFFSAMEYAYSAADIVISRAGATSISEVARYGLPLILIPYPFARGHQLKNASHLKENNAAMLIQEHELNPRMLRDKILELSGNSGLRESMSRNISMLSQPNASQVLAGLVLNE